ncbi:unnamed protein product [Coregonus sp. 'balchen']|nr:unnamed protein product [Coregonus sp. 'balchen']
MAETSPDWPTLDVQRVKCEREAQMTEWLNNIWPENQVEEYMKETSIQRAQWTRQNGTRLRST